MSIKKFRPTTPTLRNTVLVSSKGLTQGVKTPKALNQMTLA